MFAMIMHDARVSLPDYVDMDMITRRSPIDAATVSIDSQDN